MLQAAATPDWLELYNTASQPVNLAGYTLTDDVLRPERFVFPLGTTIAAKDYLVVWCDARTNAPGLHSGFGLSAQGQTLALFAPQSASFIPLFHSKVVCVSSSWLLLNRCLRRARLSPPGPFTRTLLFRAA